MKMYFAAGMTRLTSTELTSYFLKVIFDVASKDG